MKRTAGGEGHSLPKRRRTEAGSPPPGVEVGDATSFLVQTPVMAPISQESGYPPLEEQLLWASLGEGYQLLPVELEGFMLGDDEALEEWGPARPTDVAAEDRSRGLAHFMAAGYDTTDPALQGDVFPPYFGDETLTSGAPILTHHELLCKPLPSSSPPSPLPKQPLPKRLVQKSKTTSTLKSPMGFYREYLKYYLFRELLEAWKKEPFDKKPFKTTTSREHREYLEFVEHLERAIIKFRTSTRNRNPNLKNGITEKYLNDLEVECKLVSAFILILQYKNKPEPLPWMNVFIKQFIHLN